MEMFAMNMKAVESRSKWSKHARSILQHVCQNLESFLKMFDEFDG